eukprot:9910268-Prorocentrum_lima.AAC.1
MHQKHGFGGSNPSTWRCSMGVCYIAWKECTIMLSFAYGQKSLLKWCVVIHFPTMPEVQTVVDIHETSNIPILIALPQMPHL